MEQDKDKSNHWEMKNYPEAMKKCRNHNFPAGQEEIIKDPNLATKPRVRQQNDNRAEQNKNKKYQDNKTT